MMKENKLAVIYARFSAEDNEDNGGARSIENQITLLSEYAHKNNFKIVKTYADYGKTGTNMNRPGLKELYKDMYEGLFDTIIVKDLSRFSRNYIEAGEYLENIFPSFNIRFISVSDNYDSAYNSDDESIVLRNFLNSMYSKDIKKKIHKSLKRRVKTDDLVFVVKYGFKKDSNGNLIVDEYAASIVRRIFDEAISGKKPIEIARGLELDHIYTPSAYKKYVLKIKPNREPDINRLYKWDSSVIRAMLKDLEYCGHAVNLTAKKPSRVINDKNIIVRNIRPVIIDEETFNKAPKAFKENKPRSDKYLKSLIYCKHCGKLMYYNESKKEHVGTYYCSNCHVKIDGDTLKEVLYLDSINVLKESKCSPEEFISNFIKGYSHLNQHEELEKQLKIIEHEIQILFEENINGRIESYNYLNKLKQLNEAYDSLELKLKALPKKLDIKAIQYNYYEFIKNIDKELQDKDEVIKSIIKKVFIEFLDEKFVVDIMYIFE